MKLHGWLSREIIGKKNDEMFNKNLEEFLKQWMQDFLKVASVRNPWWSLKFDRCVSEGIYRILDKIIFERFSEIITEVTYGSFLYKNLKFPEKSQQ